MHRRRYLAEGRERSKGPADEDKSIRDGRRNFVQEVISVSNAKMRRFGLPRVIVTDNGTQLVNDPFKGWCEKWKIKQMNTAVAHPQTNGLVERANKSLMLGLKARLGRERVGWRSSNPSRNRHANLLNHSVERSTKQGRDATGFGPHLRKKRDIGNLGSKIQKESGTVLQQASPSGVVQSGRIRVSQERS
ncbi:reverse transcriptase domain-containing protein [Tanacetum coccineum]